MRVITDIARAAFSAIEFDRSREDAENERVPEQEERVKLADRRATNDRNPREHKRKCGECPHTLPKPAFNKVFVAHVHHNNCLPREMASAYLTLGSIACIAAL